MRKLSRNKANVLSKFHTARIADTKVLFSYPNDIRVAKILVAANYSGVSITVPIVPFPEAAEADEWKSKNPLNQFPWLDTPHGALFHTNAILRYGVYSVKFCLVSESLCCWVDVSFS